LYLKEANTRENPELLIQKIEVADIDPSANAATLLACASLQ